MKHISDRLLELVSIHAAGKHTVFAKNAGIPHGTFSAYLKGRVPHPDHLCRIHDIYNVNINWLLTGEGDPYIYKEEKVGASRRGAPVPDAAGLKPDDFGLAVSGLKEIFDSCDPILIPAIQANIRAFQISARREQQNRELIQKVGKLEGECEDLKKRLDEMEKQLKQKQDVKPQPEPDQRRAANGN